MHSRRLILAVAAALACAPTPDPRAPTPDAPPRLETTSEGYEVRLGAAESGAPTTIAAPIARTWSALVAAYSSLDVTADIVNTAEYTYGVQRHTQPRIGGRHVNEYVRCAFEGSGPSSAGMYRTEISFRTTLHALNDSMTVLATQVGATGRRVDGTSTGPVRCASTGVLESRIASLVRERVATAR